jgi:hypothetical protein
MSVSDFSNSERIPIFALHADAFDVYCQMESHNSVNECVKVSADTPVHIHQFFANTVHRECVRGLKSRSTRIGPVISAQ